MLWKGSATTRTVLYSRGARQRVLCVIGSFAFVLIAVFGSTHVSWAQTAQSVDNVAAVGVESGLTGSNDLYVIIGRIIYAFLSVLGLVFLGYLLYAGYLWMTAGEGAEKPEQARRMIQNAIIGLVIVASAFAITAFILSRLTDISTETVVDDSVRGPTVSFPSAAGSLGSGIIEYHVPTRDATNVPRNTSIIVTFKEPMKLSSLVQGYNDAGTPTDLTDDYPTTLPPTGLNIGTIHIVKRDAAREEVLTSDQVEVHFTEDRKTFVFKPREWLGSPSVNTSYRIEIMPGRTGLLREDGRPAFTAEYPSGYRWTFEVSTVVDLTPPQITSIVPASGSQPPNSIIQINFNEAIDPTSASGIFRAGRGFSNVAVTRASADPTSPVVPIEGEWRISNRYQTIEFIADYVCGANACGREIRCLPYSSTIALLVRAASLIAPASPQARIVSTAGGGALYDGIVDVASNSLDGNGNGTAQGAPLDNRASAFQTSATVVTTAPRIETIEPVYGVADYPIGSSNLPPNHEPQASFGPRPLEINPVNILQASTVNSTNVYIMPHNEPVAMASDTFWFTPYETVVLTPGVDGAPAIPTFGRVTINHRQYARSLVTAPSGSLPPVYAPIITSGVQNLLQNCFKPSGSATCAATVGSGLLPGNPNCCDGSPGSTHCSFSHRTP